MNRLGIFVVYDPDGIVDEYVLYMLKSLHTVIKKLIIVVNGRITSESFKKISKYSECIYIRNNIGYDGGAYKDTILKYLKDENWENWDELVLMNDTFYGPFYPWEEVFENMNNIDADFWGLSKFIGSEKKKLLNDSLIPSYIHGYFIVCRKNIINNKDFFEFWNNLEYPNSYIEAVENFEINFSIYFNNKGFKSSSYIESINSQIVLKKDERIYFSKAYELIKKCKFPILKRQAISIINFRESHEAIKYIQENNQYETSLITNNISRLNKLNRIRPFSPDKLEEFYKKHEKIYIFGRGQYGLGLVEYFKYKSWNFEKYIVTENTENYSDTISLNEIKLSKNDGVIVALGPKVYKEVSHILTIYFNQNQLFLPNYINLLR